MKKTIIGFSAAFAIIVCCTAFTFGKPNKRDCRTVYVEDGDTGKRYEVNGEQLKSLFDMGDTDGMVDIIDSNSNSNFMKIKLLICPGDGYRCSLRVITHNACGQTVIGNTTETKGLNNGNTEVVNVP